MDVLSHKAVQNKEKTTGITNVGKYQIKYSSTCHERTPSGPGKSVRTLQVAARDRDGWAGGGRQI